LIDFSLKKFQQSCKNFFVGRLWLWSADKLYVCPYVVMHTMDFISQMSTKSILPVAGLQYMQQCFRKLTQSSNSKVEACPWDFVPVNVSSSQGSKAGHRSRLWIIQRLSRWSKLWVFNCLRNIEMGIKSNLGYLHCFFQL
jgi:hypothetical protein